MSYENGSRRRTQGSELTNIRAHIFTFLGIGATAAGGYAVFSTDNQVDTGALLILGALFTIIGLSRKLPSKFSMGENSIEWDRTAAEAIQERIEDTPPQDRIEAVREVEAVAPPRILSNLNRWLISTTTYNRSVELALKILVDKMEKNGKNYVVESVDSFTRHFPESRPVQWDFTITGEGQYIAIEEKNYTSKKIDSKVINQLLGMSQADSKTPDKVILVTSAQLTKSAQDTVELSNQPEFKGPKIEIVRSEPEFKPSAIVKLSQQIENAIKNSD